MRNGDPRFVVQRHWSDDETDRLAEIIAEGNSFTTAGQLLGRTKNSCISRFHGSVAAKFGEQAA